MPREPPIMHAYKSGFKRFQALCFANRTATRQDTVPKHLSVAVARADQIGTALGPGGAVAALTSGVRSHSDQPGA